MKVLEFLGGFILAICFIIGIFSEGLIVLFAPIAFIFILILLICGCKLK